MIDVEQSKHKLKYDNKYDEIEGVGGLVRSYKSDVPIRFQEKDCLKRAIIKWSWHLPVSHYGSSWCTLSILEIYSVSSEASKERYVLSNKERVQYMCSCEKLSVVD